MYRILSVNDFNKVNISLVTLRHYHFRFIKKCVKIILSVAYLIRICFNIYSLFIKRWVRELARLIPHQPAGMQGGNADSDKSK